MNSYLAAGLTFCAVAAAIGFLKWLAIKILKESREPASLKYLSIRVARLIGPFFYVVLSADAGLRLLNNFPPRLLAYADKITIVITTAYIIIALGYVLDFMAAMVIKRQLKVDPQSSPAITEFFSRLVKFALWIAGFLSLLANFGYNITALLTGLGIGGVAVAFALQNILTDIFASVSIYFDQPFRVGDFIVIGNDMGNVTKIGIKSTRLQTLEGQELIISNKELTSLHINNYKRMSRRRVAFSFGVPLSTSTENVKKIPEMVSEIIKKQPKATVDRIHFNKIDADQFCYEVVYFLDTADHNFYMDTQQNISLAMLNLFRQESINWTLPARPNTNSA